MRFVAGGAPWRRAIWKMLAGVPRRSAIWQVLARAPRRSAIWKMMAGALWRRGWPGRRGEEPSGSNCGRKCQCGSIGKRLLARPLWKSKAAIAEEQRRPVRPADGKYFRADCRRRGLEFEGDFCQEVDLCLRIYALPAEVFRTIYKVVLAIPSVRVVLFVEEVVYNSGEGNTGAAL